MYPDRLFISFLPFDLSMNIYILFLYKLLLNSLYSAVINGKEHMGTSINCREHREYKADGAQKPECTREYMRISSTAQRRNHGAQQINRGAHINS